MASFRSRNGALQVSIRRKGFAPIYETFDDTPAGRKEAELWAKRIELEIEAKAYVEPDTSGQLPLRDALVRYRDEVTIGKKGNKAEKNRINQLMTYPLTDRTMGELNTQLVADFRDELLDRNYSASHVNKYLSIISSVYKKAAEEWSIQVPNPTINVRRPQQNDARDRRLEGNEDELIMQSLPPHGKLIFTIMLETAMRRSEIAVLEWKNVFLKERYLLLKHTKNGTARAIPLSKKAIEAFVDIGPKKQGRVLQVHRDTLSHWFLEARKAHNLADIRLHDMRHEATSRLAEKGTLDILEIAAITGHKSLAQLQRYTHHRAGRLASKLD